LKASGGSLPRTDVNSVSSAPMSKAAAAGGPSLKRTASRSEGGVPFAQRLARLAAAMSEAQLPALLVTNPKDVGYLTGFLGGDSYLLVPGDFGARAGAVPTLITDFRYKEEVEPVEQAGLARLHIRSRSMTESVAELLGPSAKGDDGKRVGIQAEHMTIAEKAALGRKVEGGAKRLVDTAGLVSRLRATKDQTEIALIRKAVKLQEQALEAVLPTIKPGQTELEIAARLESEMKSRGSSEPGFQTIVAAGANGSLPHYRPAARKLAANKPVLIDWGAVYRGYHGDMTRTLTLGKWPAKVKEIYAVVLDAHLAAAAALAPGKSSEQIDGIARTHITKHGYAEFFGHGLGHGIGLNGHEDPRLTNMLKPSKLEPGMVVTIEPGIYLPGVGGVRIEDDYVITEDGAENLCSLPKDLEWATL